MKQSLDDSEQLRRLEPSKFSAEGFLGTDKRALEKIISDDERVLEDLGISRDRLADALESAYLQARNALGADVEVAPGVIAVYDESRGKVPSPFRGDGVFEKGDVVLTDTTGRKVVITLLSINLIRKHGFFQGLGSPFRVDPEEAVHMLRLVPDA